MDDTFDVQRFQVFDFEAMRAYPALLEPLLFYVLHRVGSRIADAAAGHAEALCHGRGVAIHPARDASRLRAGGAEDLAQAQCLRCCWRRRPSTTSRRRICCAPSWRAVPTKLLLANPALDRRQYADLFQLNETELDLVAGLMPRRQLLVKRPGVAKVLTLNVDPRSYWLYTNTPVDNERVRAAFVEHGFDGGLDQLVASA